MQIPDAGTTIPEEATGNLQAACFAGGEGGRDAVKGAGGDAGAAIDGGEVSVGYSEMLPHLETACTSAF